MDNKEIKDKIEELKTVIKGEETKSLENEVASVKSMIKEVADKVYSLFDKKEVEAAVDMALLPKWFEIAFDRKPESDPGYYAEWKSRFETGTPERYMDKERQRVYKDLIEGKEPTKPTFASIEKDASAYTEFVKKWYADHKDAKPGDEASMKQLAEDWEKSKTASENKVETVSTRISANKVDMEKIALTDTHSLHSVENNEKLLQLFEGETAKGIFVEVIASDNAVEQYKQKLGLAQKQESNIQVENKESNIKVEDKGMSKLVFKVSDEDNVLASTLTASDEKESLSIAMEQVVPDVVKEAILKSDASVITPEEMIKQLAEQCPDMESFKIWAKKKEKKFQIKKKIKEMKDKIKSKVDDKKEEKVEKVEEKKASRRTAADMWAQKKEDEVKPKEVIVSQDPKEQKADTPKPTTNGGGAVVKKYLNQLPSKSVGKPEVALRPGESRLMSILKKKIDDKQAQLDTKQAEIAKKEEELSKKAKEQEEKDKAEKIHNIISEMRVKNLIAEGSIDETINDLKVMGIPALDQFFKLISKSAAMVKEASLDSDGNIAHVFETESKSEDVITKLGKIWNQ